MQDAKGNKMKSKLIVLLFLLLSVEVTWSKSTENFEKRFKLVRKDGVLVSVIDNSITMNFGLKKYVRYIKEKIKNEQKMIYGSFDYDSSVRELFNDEQSLMRNASKGKTYIDYLVESLNELPRVNVDKVFNNPKFVEVLEAYESKLGDVLAKLDPRVIARPQDSSFFYKKRATYQALQWGLSFAKKRLSTIPMLNTAAYVMVEVEKLVRTRREFHQNMFLHYLNEFEEAELGITEIEANQIFSSIYESRIPWFAFWESSAAKSNWNAYGARKFFAGVRMANKRFRSVSRNYDRGGQRVTYSFQEVSFEGDDVIINLFDNEGMLHSTPAVAYSVNNPKKIARKRLLLQLGGLGVSFLPVSQFIKDIVDNGLKSYYEKQMITEGALYGHFESSQNSEGLSVVKNQYLNPFETNL